MKTRLYVALALIVILSLCALAPGTPGPQKTKPPTEPPPVETLPPPPPPPTEPPQITEPPGTEPPEVTEPPEKPTEPGEPPEHGVTPEPKVTPWSGGGEKAEPKEIRLPQGGYGPVAAQPMSAGTIARWGALFLIGLAGIFLAGRALR